jgi:hypothetical protein
MDCARRHHAAPMGLKTVLFGLVYYKHVAPMELAVAAQQVIIQVCISTRFGVLSEQLPVADENSLFIKATFIPAPVPL